MGLRSGLPWSRQSWEPGSALEEYKAMSEATLIILQSDWLQVVEGLQLTLNRQDQEEFYLGFPEDNLSDKPAVVRGLDPNSRAAEAGVLEGDTITPQYSFFFSAERWGQKFSMTVRRGMGDGESELKEPSWWPRGREKVEIYQFV